MATEERRLVGRRKKSSHNFKSQHKTSQEYAELAV
jgi:hypothetical protein